MTSVAALLSLKWLVWPAILLAMAGFLLACSSPGFPIVTQVPGDPTMSALPSTAAATPSIADADGPAPLAEGSIEQGSVYSTALQEDIHYYAYLPAGYAHSQDRHPVIYLLHGRGDNMADWAKVKQELDQMIAAGEAPQLIAVMPDAPWSRRASYYVDSQYGGAQSPGKAVETAFVSDLIPHIDAVYRTIPERNGRSIAGYSMGGYGALRYALAHADLFIGAIVLSPAVYVPLPPAESSTREFGAFGRGDELFDESIWVAQNYPNTSELFLDTGLESHLFIAVGDDEYKHPRPEDRLHDLDMEAHLLFNHASRIKGLSADLRVLEGGHTWDVWRPGFVEGMQLLSQYLTGPRTTGPLEVRDQGN